MTDAQMLSKHKMWDVNLRKCYKIWGMLGKLNYSLCAKRNPSPGERVPPQGAGVEGGRKRGKWIAETALGRLKVSAGLKMYRNSGYLPHSTSDPLFLAALGRATFSPGEGLAPAAQVR